MILLLALLLQADDAGALIERLRSAKPEDRSVAADKLKDLGRAAVPALEEAAKSPDPALADQAKYLLKVVPIREKLSSIVYGLMPDVEDRLARGGVEAWTQVLMDTLKKDKDGDPIYTSLRKTDLEALAIPVVEGEKDPRLRLAAVELVVEWKLQRMLPTLAKVLEDPDPDLRVAAARAIGRLAGREYANQIIRALQDRDANVCIQAIDTLKLLKARDAVAPELFPLLRDPRVEVRVKALSALKELRVSNTEFEIVVLLKDVNLPLRAAAAQALGELGGRAKLADLAALLRDADAEVRRAALWSLGVLDAKEVVANIVPLLGDPVAGVRARAAEALARINVKEPKLVALLEDPNDDVRFRAAWSLGELGFGEAELRKAAKSDHVLPAAAAAYALGRLGVVDAIPEILALTRRGVEPSARSLAVTALGGVGGEAELRKLLEDPEPSIRRAALQSLGRLNADAEYQKLLTDVDPTVRMWAGLALARRGIRDGVPAVMEAAPKCTEVSFLWLNRLHAQELWNRLENTTLDQPLEGTLDEILEQLNTKTRAFLQRWPHSYRYQPRFRIPAGTSLLGVVERLEFWSRSEYLSDGPATRARFELLFISQGIQMTSPENAIANHKYRIEHWRHK
jgi:HEAT repeat protein